MIHLKDEKIDRERDSSLQIMTAEVSKVRWKEIRIKELKWAVRAIHRASNLSQITIMKHHDASRGGGLSNVRGLRCDRSSTRQPRRANPETFTILRNGRPVPMTISTSLIGAGGMGGQDTLTALSTGRKKLVTVCDLYDGRLKDARDKWGRIFFTTQ